YGVRLGDAEIASREAIAILASENIVSARENSERLGNYQDTLAYILMQTGRISDALMMFSEAVQNNRSNSITFRYAIAEFAQGQKTQALKDLKEAMQDKNYLPSHELHLLWEHINKEGIRDEIESLLNRTQQMSAARRDRPRQGSPEPCLAMPSPGG